MGTTIGEARLGPKRLTHSLPAEAQAELVLGHDWLARVIARRAKLAWREESLDDLFQLARVGIVKAARVFDPSLGKRFVALASFYAHGEIAHAIRKRGLIKFDARGNRRGRPMTVSLENLSEVVYPTADAERLMVWDYALDTIEQRTDLRAFLRKLPHREQVVLFYTYVYPIRQTEIARRLRITQRHVSRLLARLRRRAWGHGPGQS